MKKRNATRLPLGLAALALASLGLAGPAAASCTEDGCYEPPGGGGASSPTAEMTEIETPASTSALGRSSKGE